MARPRAMPGCPTCPGERCASHRIATRGPPFSAEPIGSWSRGKCHQLVRFPRLNSATGRCRWFNPRASARHPYQVLSAVAQSRTRSRPTSSSDTSSTSQVDAILPANTLQPLARQLIPKTHGRFIPAQASHCGSSPSSADPPRRCRTMATLTCVTLLFAVVSGLNMAPQHVRIDAAIGPRLAVDVPEPRGNTPDVAGRAARSA